MAFELFRQRASKQPAIASETENQRAQIKK